MTPGNYWIGVVSRAHTQLGVAGGFVQLGHGKRAPLARLRAGDGIVLYSPRIALDDLSFVADKAHWGTALRFGQLKISTHDLALIARAMGCAALASATA